MCCIHWMDYCGNLMGEISLSAEPTYTEQESTCAMHFLHRDSTTFSAPRGSISFDGDKMRAVSCTSAQQTMYFMELRGMTKANSQFEWEVCMRHADGHQSEKESKSFQRRTGNLSMNVALLFFLEICTLKDGGLWFHFVMTYGFLFPVSWFLMRNSSHHRTISV